jgi:predicted translin family RNA/ssDNA-binding protein
LESELKDWILPDLVRYKTEMEQDLHQMMEHLLARQEDAEAQAAASLKELKDDINGYTEATISSVQSEFKQTNQK